MGAGSSTRSADGQAADTGTLRASLETSQKEEARLQAEVERLQAELEAKKSSSTDGGLADELAILNSENAVFSKTLDTLQQEVTRLRIENENLKGEVKGKQVELTQAFAESNSLALQLRAMRKQVGAADDADGAKDGAAGSLLDEQLFSYKLDSKDQQKLRQIQRRTHFHEVTTERLFDVFKANAGEEGDSLDKRQFLAAITQLGTVPVSQQFLFSRFYTLFDRDGDEKVDFGEFAGGLSVLCAGTPSEKLKLVFRCALLPLLTACARRATRALALCAERACPRVRAAQLPRRRRQRLAVARRADRLRDDAAGRLEGSQAGRDAEGE